MCVCVYLFIYLFKKCNIGTKLFANPRYVTMSVHLPRSLAIILHCKPWPWMTMVRMLWWLFPTTQKVFQTVILQAQYLITVDEELFSWMPAGMQSWAVTPANEMNIKKAECPANLWQEAGQGPVFPLFGVSKLALLGREQEQEQDELQPRKDILSWLMT